MRENKNRLVTAWITLLVLLGCSQTIYSADYLDNISEEYLRSVFTFGSADKLKYSECKKKSYPTCTYVWGTKSDKDAIRIKHGQPPGGNQLMVIYAQAGARKDFQRVTATYSDAVTVKGIGEEAVWSAKRRQLSLITDKNLVVHVNIREKGKNSTKEKSIAVAQHVLEKL